jgi:hypothetical protein
VKDVLSSGLLSNPFRLVSVVSDAAASMTTDSGMSVSDLVGIAESLRHLSSKNVQFVTAPNQPWPSDPTARVEFAQPQAGQVFSAIAHDTKVPKVSQPTTPAGGAQLLTTSPSKVKVKVLNGSGVQGIADQAAASLTSRGFDVTGTGDATSFAYTKSVIEYASTADMAEVNTLKQVLTNVTELHDASLTPGTVDLILGSDFTGLKPASAGTGTSTSTGASASTSASASVSASPSVSASTSTSAPPSTSASPSTSVSASTAASPSASASASGVASLAQSNGGITAAASCASDSSAFAGPLSP